VLSQTGAQERLKFFTEMALAMIGGHFREATEPEGDEMPGISFYLYKKAWKIEMRNKNAPAYSVRAVDLKLREILQVEDRDAFSIKYQSHDGKRANSCHIGYDGGCTAGEDVMRSFYVVVGQAKRGGERGDALYTIGRSGESTFSVLGTTRLA